MIWVVQNKCNGLCRRKLVLQEDKKMNIEFTKMQGCGNDYVYIDGARFDIPMEKKPAGSICSSWRKSMLW